MANQFCDLFEAIQRSPKRAAKAGSGGTELLIEAAAPVIVGECLAQDSKGFTTLEVFKKLPQLAGRYSNSNSLGTALGQGVSQKGLGLYRDASGRFLRCRQNAALAARKLGDEAFALLAAELGFGSPEALTAAIAALPSAPEA